MQPMLPLDYIGITRHYTSNHRAIDLGWHDYEGEPVYSALEGKVVLSGTYSDAGNILVIATKYNDKTILTRYLHLKDKPKYQLNDKVKQFQHIGDMGNTGDTSGTHLHFEYWICPKNYRYKFKDQAIYAVDPLKYCYVFPEQTVNEEDKDKVKYANNIAYTVVKGDTLSRIAREYNTTYQKLATYNNIPNPNKIYVGQIINIPYVNDLTYTVVKGDTLTKIAHKYNTTVTKLYQDNKDVIGDNPNKIYPGQTLVIQ